MPEPVVLHKCPSCGRVFSSPSVCEDGSETVETPMVVSKQQLRALLAESIPGHASEPKTEEDKRDA